MLRARQASESHLMTLFPHINAKPVENMAQGPGNLHPCENSAMLLRAARLLGAPSSRLLPPPVCACRPFCSGVSEESTALVQSFLERASRPIMGKARAKQSAGQRALDLTKQAKNFEGMDLPALLRLDGAALKKLGIPCQERKRLMKFSAKANQGQALVGRDWKGGTWREAERDTWRERGGIPGVKAE